MFNDYAREDLESEFNARYDYLHEIAHEHRETHDNEDCMLPELTEEEKEASRLRQEEYNKRCEVYVIDENGNKILYEGDEPPF